MPKSLDCLLLHGWGVSKVIMEDFAGFLSGFDKVSSPCLYEVAEKTKDNNVNSIATSLAKDLNVDTIIVAWSLGGLIATPLARLSKKVKAIVYIASTPCFINKGCWCNVIDSKSIDDLQSNLSKDIVKTLEYFSGLIAHGDSSAKETNKLVRNRLAAEKYVEILSAWLLQMQEIDQRKELSQLEIPLLFVFGEYDSLINLKIENQIKQLNENINTKVINNCGHAPFLSKRKISSKIINEFLNERVS